MSFLKASSVVILTTSIAAWLPRTIHAVLACLLSILASAQVGRASAKEVRHG